MRIVHLADVHLGYRAYNRVTRQGLNWREADVFNAFRQSLSKIAEIQPDLIVIAGDLFHVVRPSNLCIQHTFGELLNLRSKCDAPIVMIGGNHDSPRSADTGCILDLFRNVPKTYVVHNEYKGITIPEIDTTVFCLCHRALAGLSSLKIEPNSSTKYNVLTLHGTFEGLSKNFHDTVPPITKSQVAHELWDYVALGHYHVYEQLGDNIFYSGSLEYSSSSIWQEVVKPKGFIEYDLDKHELVKFHETKTRDVVDLRPIDATDRSAAELDQLIMHRVDGIKDGHNDKIIRLIIENMPKSIVPDLNYRAIRQLRTEALHFDMQFRPPKREGLIREDNGTHTSRPLEDEWRDFVKDYEITGDIDREKLLEKGLEYLAPKD